MPESNKHEQSLGRRIVMFPLVRAIIAIAMIIVATMLTSRLTNALGEAIFSEPMPELWKLTKTVITIVVALFAYAVFVKYVERRSESEIACTGAVEELLQGVTLGAGLFSAVIAAIWISGSYQVLSVHNLPVLIPPLYTSLSAGFIEEVIFRGIIFRIMQESLGSWIAIAVSAALFGFGHAANPNATLYSSVAIALEAGILLAAAFMFTRRLWLAIGLHFAWNFTQGGIFGVAVSGHDVRGLLNAQLSGHELITGGNFGAEASIFALIFCVIAGAYLLVLAKRRGHFVQPFWMRKE
ncbi:MAG: CPBP family intramembrane metalloprotease [Deferribacteres bacterium]|nr:CPBP family intramembrane metalloprotease [candidate division KSB1 bacterium]MCB9503640.1 CPBP family intramembrane metalloprotease [Deferribacteres bacterium]